MSGPAVVVHAFADEAAPARRLADRLGAPLGLVDVHAFPDGETLPTTPACAPTVIVYRSLDRPNDKLIPLLLAVDAWRRGGARRLVLVAPYLCYLRQDTVFAPGQPVSRDVIGQLIGSRFDALVTVQPHLHRTADLSPVFQGIPVAHLSAMPALAAAMGHDPDALVFGPDAESRPWAETLAAAMGARGDAFTKTRLGDRDVRLSVPDGADVAGRRVILADDVCSSGATLETCARLCRERGAASVEIVVAHALFGAETAARLAAAGVGRVLSTDSVVHPTNSVELAGLLAGALNEELVR